MDRMVITYYLKVTKTKLYQLCKERLSCILPVQKETVFEKDGRDFWLTFVDEKDGREKVVLFGACAGRAHLWLYEHCGGYELRQHVEIPFSLVLQRGLAEEERKFVCAEDRCGNGR